MHGDQVSRISKEFLDEERRSLGEWYFNQEYECIFGESEDGVFSSQFIKGVHNEDIEPLW